jgi:predicted dehydrogenase
MPPKVRTALVGLGKIAHTHAEALKNLPQSEFVAVCSRSPAKAADFARQYGVAAYTDLDTMLAQANVQMLAILTPHPLHAAQIERAAAHGAHVLVEKPLASDLADCDRAIAACNRAGVKLGVVSQRRFYQPVARVRQAISAGKIGRPILAAVTVLGYRDEAYYRSDPWRGRWDAEGGGVLVNQTPHQLDLLQWLMGPIDELFGYWDNFNHPYVEIDDSAVAVLRFKSGALGTIMVSNSQNPGLYGQVQVHGSNGATVGAQPEGGSMFISSVTTHVDPPINHLWTVPGEEHLLPQWQEQDRQRAGQINVMTHYHKLQIDDFLQAIVDNRPPAVDGHEGRKVVEIFTAIYRSQRDRQPVKFPLEPETGRTDYDGRLSHTLFSRSQNL